MSQAENINNIPIEKIVLNPILKIRDVDKEHTSGLVAAIAGGETLPPILVRECRNETFELIDGNHRLQAVVEYAKEREISARIITCTDAEAIARATEANLKHGLPLRAKDRIAAAKAYTTVLSKGGEANSKTSARKIADMFGISPTTASNILKELQSVQNGHEKGERTSNQNNDAIPAKTFPRDPGATANRDADNDRQPENPSNPKRRERAIHTTRRPKQDVLFHQLADDWEDMRLPKTTAPSRLNAEKPTSYLLLVIEIEQSTCIDQLNSILAFINSSNLKSGGE